MKTRQFVVSLVCLAGLASTAVHAEVTGFAWGANNTGQLGNGTYSFSSFSSTPQAIPGLSGNSTTITAGESHGLAVVDGALYSWGYNEVGELGIGGTATTPTPTAVPSFSSGVGPVSGGGYFSVAIKNGAAYSWGYNLFGQLGNGTIDPVFQVHDTPAAIVGLGSGVTALSSGFAHTLAIQSGSVVSWGRNHLGQLGNGTMSNSPTVGMVTGLESGVTKIATGSSHSLAIKDGAVYSWGSNSGGELGNTLDTHSTQANIILALDSGVTAIAAGSAFSMAVVDGDVYTWGANARGQLGHGTADGGNYLVPDLVTTITSEIIDVAAKSTTAYALGADGTIWAWGRNNNGQLGIGFDSEFLATPTQLFAPDGYLFTLISAGPDFAYSTIIAIPAPASGLAMLVPSVALLTRRRR